MSFCRKLVVLACGAMGMGVALVAWGQQSGAESSVVAVEERSAEIMSEGVRLHEDLYYPKSAGQGPLPAIVMSHGWGGTAAMLSSQATDFARAGYFVIAFDYRGCEERLPADPGTNRPLILPSERITASQRK
jgi:predicted dienelactone hydrolase